MKKGSVPQRLFDEGFDYKEEEPLLRKQRKKKISKGPSPPPLVEEKESEEGDTASTTPLDSINYEQPESEHLSLGSLS